MESGRSIKIIVPATSANLGPGFDCIGAAWKLYNTTTFTLTGGKPGTVSIAGPERPGAPQKDKTNMIYEAMAAFYRRLEPGRRHNAPAVPGVPGVPGIEIKQEDNIPKTRGLGSSAACVAAGLMAANCFSGANLSRDELALMASNLEGHSDNASAALFGGIVVSVLTGDKLEYVKIANDNLKELRFCAAIPCFTVPTRRSRGVLPRAYQLKDVVFNASRAALLAASLACGDLSKLSTAMEDCMHQPYRARIITNMSAIFKKARSLGAEAVFLSGSGPTIIAVARADGFDPLIAGLSKFTGPLPGKWRCSELTLDFDGARII